VVYLVFNEGYSASAGVSVTRHDLSAEAIRLGRLVVELLPEPEALVQRALASRRFGPYTLQAAIAAVHAEAPTAADTDWGQIVGLYEVLLRIEPSPVVELNRAAAVAMRDGPAAGLALVDAILARGDLAQYYLAHSARADLCRRLGRADDARASYRLALELTRQEPERRFLERRLRELDEAVIRG